MRSFSLDRCVRADGDRAAAGHRRAHQARPDDEQDGPGPAGAAAGDGRALPDVSAYC